MCRDLLLKNYEKKETHRDTVRCRGNRSPWGREIVEEAFFNQKRDERGKGSISERERERNKISLFFFFLV